MSAVLPAAAGPLECSRQPSGPVIINSYWRAALYALFVAIAIVATAPVDDGTRDQSIEVRIVRYATKADARR